MSVSKIIPSIEGLMGAGDWGKARKCIVEELSEDPENHWLLTHLGVTYYEQQKYREALTPLLDSLKVVPDCPLTLWNLAGTLDALGKPKLAIRIFTWLLRSEKTPDEDPCWESEAWRDSLKTDCVYRLGVCFQHLEQWESARHCFRQFIDLLLAGMGSIYTADDAAHRIQEIPAGGNQQVEEEVRNAIKSILHDAGVQSVQGTQRKLPRLSLSKLLAT
jgi:hypothetical protein